MLTERSTICFCGPSNAVTNQQGKKVTKREMESKRKRPCVLTVKPGPGPCDSVDSVEQGSAHVLGAVESDYRTSNDEHRNERGTKRTERNGLVKARGSVAAGSRTPLYEKGAVQGKGSSSLRQRLKDVTPSTRVTFALTRTKSLATATFDYLDSAAFPRRTRTFCRPQGERTQSQTAALVPHRRSLEIFLLFGHHPAGCRPRGGGGR